MVCAELSWVDVSDFGWGCGDRVTFVSNVPNRYFLSSRAMVLRLEPSMITFSSIFWTSPCYGNTFI